MERYLVKCRVNSTFQLVRYSLFCFMKTEGGGNPICLRSVCELDIIPHPKLPLMRENRLNLNEGLFKLKSYMSSIKFMH